MFVSLFRLVLMGLAYRDKWIDPQQNQWLDE